MKLPIEQLEAVASLCSDLHRSIVLLEAYVDDGLVPAALRRMQAIEQHAQELRRALEGLEAE